MNFSEGPSTERPASPRTSSSPESCRDSMGRSLHIGDGYMKATRLSRVLSAIASCFGFAIIVRWTIVLSSQFLDRSDYEVICLDLWTGKEIWVYQRSAIGPAKLDLYDSMLIVHPRFDDDSDNGIIALDSKTGALAPLGSNSATPIVSESPWCGRPPRICLSNGWSLENFKPGDSDVFTFLDPGTKRIMWQINTHDYPRECGAWKNLFFYASGDNQQRAVIYTYMAGGDSPERVTDLNSFTDLHKTLRDASLRVIDDYLIAQSLNHVFVFSPQSGELKLHIDLCTDLSLKYSEMYDELFPHASISVTHGVILIAMENRVVAYDMKRHRYLWHLYPDTAPRIPVHVVSNGRLWLTAGKQRQLYQITDWTDCIIIVSVGTIGCCIMGLLTIVIRRIRAGADSLKPKVPSSQHPSV